MRSSGQVKGAPRPIPRSVPAVPYPTGDDSPGIYNSDRCPQSDSWVRKGKGRVGGLIELGRGKSSSIFAKGRWSIAWGDGVPCRRFVAILVVGLDARGQCVKSEL